MKKLLLSFLCLLFLQQVKSQFLESSLAISSQLKRTIGEGVVDEKSKRFFMFGQSTINSTADLINQLQGSQKLNFTAVLKQQKEGKGLGNTGIDLSMSFNILNLKPNGISRDSFDLTSLMFPETGNAGFMIAPSWNWSILPNESGGHRWATEASFSLRQNSVDNLLPANDSLSSKLEDIRFAVLNFNFMPIKYSFLYESEEDFKFTLNMGIYWNFFNIPNEDASMFNKLFPEDAPMFPGNNQSNVKSVGFKCAAGINGLLFFTDIRYNYSTKGFNDENPFKGTVFNFGIAQNLAIFQK